MNMIKRKKKRPLPSKYAAMESRPLRKLAAKAGRKRDQKIGLKAQRKFSDRRVYHG